MHAWDLAPRHNNTGAFACMQGHAFRVTEGAYVGEEQAGFGVDGSVHDVLHLAHGACKGEGLVVGGHQVGGVLLAVLGGSVLHMRRHSKSAKSLPQAVVHMHLVQSPTMARQWRVVWSRSAEPCHSYMAVTESTSAPALYNAGSCQGLAVTGDNMQCKPVKLRVCMQLLWDDMTFV